MIHYHTTRKNIVQMITKTSALEQTAELELKAHEVLHELGGTPKFDFTGTLFKLNLLDPNDRSIKTFPRIAVITPLDVKCFNSKGNFCMEVDVIFDIEETNELARIALITKSGVTIDSIRAPIPKKVFEGQMIKVRMKFQCPRFDAPDAYNELAQLPYKQKRTADILRMMAMEKTQMNMAKFKRFMMAKVKAA